MESREDELAQLAKKRVEARFGLATHVALYVTVNAALIAIWALTSRGYPWFLWPLFGWGIGILAHVITYAFGPDTASQQRAIERERRRLHARAH